MARKPASEQGDTLAEIRAAAFGLFGRHGYDGVSMGRVASDADITKAAIYWHYDDKKGLYLDCLAHLYEIFGEYIFEPMTTEEGTAERILLLFEGVGELLEDPRIRGGVAGYWLEAKTTDLDEARQIQADFEQRARAFLTETIEAGVAHEELELELPAGDIALAINSLMEAIVLPLRRQTSSQHWRLIRALAHTFFLATARDPSFAVRALEIGRAHADD